MSSTEKHSKEEREALPLPGATAAPKRSAFPALYLRVVAAAIVLSTLYTTFPSLFSINQLNSSAPHASHKAAWREERALRGYSKRVLEQSQHATSCHGVQQKHLSQVEVEQKFLSVPSAKSARAASRSFTGATHIAGTEGDRLTQLRIKEQWEGLLGLEVSDPLDNFFESGTPESARALKGGCSGHGFKGKKSFVTKAKRWVAHKTGFRSRSLHGELKSKPRVWIDTYWPLLNYPVSHSLTLTPANATKPSFVAKLREDTLPEDPTSGKGPLTFHGLSKNGTAKGQLVYVGRGTKEEFDELVELGINFKGKIVIAQYSGSFRGLKVSAAQDVGAVGVIIYTDPAEDGNVTVEAGLKPYPHGPARHPSAVQRGSVQFLSIYPGDPTTPGTPSYQNATRLDRDDPTLNIPSIPSIPISYEDAIPLLKSLNGKGTKRHDKPGFREGGLGYRGVEYWTGPGEEIVELVNEMDDKVTPLWNAHALIPGHISDELVILGGHTDAWTFGAGDPNSGTASVHEVVAGLGEALASGWKPLRSILIVGWSGEEYGLIGSTEFGEDFHDWLKERVVAYLNVDISVAGSNYGARASPSLAQLLNSVADEIPDPEQRNRTLLAKQIAEAAYGEEDELVADAKTGHVGILGSGSDFSVFLQHIGVASSDIGYGRTTKGPNGPDPVYQYHSSYDSEYWMEKFGDPTFERHVAVSKVLGLTALRLADSPVIPLNLTDYAVQLAKYADQVRELVKHLPADEQKAINLSAIDVAISNIHLATVSVDAEIYDVQERLAKLSEGGWRAPWTKIQLWRLLKQIRSLNHRLKGFESGFIDPEGLPGRKWYRSLVVAPGRYLGYGATTFPGLQEALTLDKDSQQAAIESKRIVAAFENVAKSLAP